jgi:hypothetical protein
MDVLGDALELDAHIECCGQDSVDILPFDHAAQGEMMATGTVRRRMTKTDVTQTSTPFLIAIALRGLRHARIHTLPS